MSRRVKIATEWRTTPRSARSWSARSTAERSLTRLDASVGKLQGEVTQLQRSEQLAAQQQLSQLLASHQRWQATGM